MGDGKQCIENGEKDTKRAFLAFTRLARIHKEERQKKKIVQKVGCKKLYLQLHVVVVLGQVLQHMRANKLRKRDA